MGLCKCRVVTTLFCFQHRTNVCEQCLVNSHPTCVVKTYLQWLQDSDFDPTCSLCHDVIEAGPGKQEVIRLACHDLFHLKCLDQYVKTSFPPHTAPAGFTCPTCKGRIIPAENLSSPVATAARTTLAKLPWAAKPIADSQQSQQQQQQAQAAAASNVASATPAAAAAAASPAVSQHSVATSSHTQRRVEPASLASPAATSSLSHVSHATSASTPYGNGVPGSGRKYGLPQQQDTFVAMPRDSDEDKYARRPANAWFAQLVGNRVSAMKPAESNTGGLKRGIFILLLVVIGLFTIIELLTRVRPRNNDDPMLDPLSNPNIRTN